MTIFNRLLEPNDYGFCTALHRDFEVVNLSSNSYLSDSFSNTFYGIPGVYDNHYSTDFLTSSDYKPAHPLQQLFGTEPYTIYDLTRNLSQPYDNVPKNNHNLNAGHDAGLEGTFRYKAQQRVNIFNCKKNVDQPSSPNNNASLYLRSKCQKNYEAIGQNGSKIGTENSTISSPGLSSKMNDARQNWKGPYDDRHSISVKIFKLECEVCHNVREYIVQITRPSKSGRAHEGIVETSFADELHLIKPCALHKCSLKTKKPQHNIFDEYENETEEIELSQDNTTSSNPNNSYSLDLSKNINERDSSNKNKDDHVEQEQEETNMKFWFERNFLTHLDCVSFTDYDNMKSCIDESNVREFQIIDNKSYMNLDGSNREYDKNYDDLQMISSPSGEQMFHVEIEISSVVESHDSGDDSEEMSVCGAEFIPASIKAQIHRQRQIHCECGDGEVHI